MTSNVDAPYITNTLSYIHLLPVNEQNKELNKILNYFKISCKKNNSSISH